MTGVVLRSMPDGGFLLATADDSRERPLARYSTPAVAVADFLKLCRLVCPGDVTVTP